MSNVKGHKLFTNIGASQARKRLKGFGFGVRKVHSAGKNQSVIIHTATGAHLTELKQLFQDVGCEEGAHANDPPIENLRNIGPRSAQWLRNSEIRTQSQLVRIGPVAAYLMVRQRHPDASLNLLWSLAAGLRDMDWRELSDDDKKLLRDQLDTMNSDHRF